jgi:hypothetical protein
VGEAGDASTSQGGQTLFAPCHRQNNRLWYRNALASSLRLAHPMILDGGIVQRIFKNADFKNQRVFEKPEKPKGSKQICFDPFSRLI